MKIKMKRLVTGSSEQNRLEIILMLPIHSRMIYNKIMLPLSYEESIYDGPVFLIKMSK